ncbi:FliM/FliN family flagellar motor switch protein [Cupriavidus sp. 30B13]|uniref:FliM/FliN family flagellar motor switch protein n=1 Tax=Cupriavidus sp. 30B13 TaxID=3384241 RepID=UPI003B90CF57
MTAARGSMTAVPRELIWWREADLAQWRELLERAMTAFAVAWDLDVAVSAFGNAGDIVLPPVLRSELAWAPLETSGLWVGCADAPVLSVRRALFGHEETEAWQHGDERDGTLTTDVANEAWRALGGALAGVFLVPEDDRNFPVAVTYPVAQRKPWSGALMAVISVRGSMSVQFGLHVPPELTRVSAPKSPRPGLPSRARIALTPVAAALGSQPIALVVTLADIELDLGALLAMQTGDVVTIPHSLQQPMTLAVRHANGGAGEPVAHAFLGAVHGTKAIELVGLADRPSTLTH